MKVVRIALSGKMRSGKDTLAGFLSEEYGLQRYALADRLKEVAVELFGMPAGGKDRHLLVELGRKMCEVDQMVWVNYVLRNIPLKCDVVVSDVRFKYEYHALKSFGFVMVRVTCEERARLERVAKHGSNVDLALMADPSETDLDDARFDHAIDGTTYGSLRSGMTEMMRAMGRKSLGLKGWEANG